MQNLTLTAHFDFNRSLLAVRSEQMACNLEALDFEMAVQMQHLAWIRYQQAQVALALALIGSSKVERTEAEDDD